MKLSVLNNLFTDFISLLLPECCEGCGGELMRSEVVLCTNCRITLPRTYNYKEIENNLKMRLSGRIHLKYALTFIKYSKKGKVRNLLHQLKYNNKEKIGITIGQLYGSELAENGFLNEFDCLIPVPLHKSKERKRGYNQSKAIADGLAMFLNAQVFSDEIIKTKETLSQTRFSGEARYKNVQNIFRTVSQERIEGKRILIVDDVITTGSTLESLYKVIEACHPLSISFLSIAEVD